MVDKVMQVRMSSSDEVVCKKLMIASSFISRLKGLMFSSELPSCDGLLISPCNSIHTFFMAYSLDVVFLDRNFKVIKVLYNLKPWRMSWIYFNSTQVLEMKAGTLNKKIFEGEILRIIYV